MSGQKTSKLIGLYNQTATVMMFLAGWFRSPPGNFHTSEKVEIDIVRSDEEVAIVITDLSTGAHINSDDLFTNKEFTPPIFDEEGTINAFDLINRQPGQNPFEAPDYQATAILKAFSLFRRLENKIRRAIELMAAQVLQTGTLTLNNASGVEMFLMSFAPKATHFPNAGTAWDANGNDPLLDMELLADVIRADGLVDVDTAIMGSSAFRWFKKNADVIAQLDNRKMETGTIAPVVMGKGGTFQGYIWIGNYRIAIWTYNGRYKHPQTGVSTPYVNPDSCIMLSSTSTVLDLTFGAIPSIVPPDGRVLKFLPSRLPNSAGGMDLSTNAWVTPDGRTLKVSAGTRPLTIPTAIDSFGCIDTLID